MCRLILFFILISFQNIHSQQLYFYKPDKLKNIPASETYNIMQDSKGYIWFSTEAGLCKYNGNNIKVFDEKNGLKEKACYSVREDKNNKLWIVTSANRILNYENDSLKEAPLSKKYSEQFKKKKLEQTYYFSFENDSLLWLSSQHNTYKVNSRSETYSLINPPRFEDNYYFSKHGDSYVPIKCDDPIGNELSLNAFKNKTVKIVIENGTKKVNIEVPYKLNTSPTWRALTSSNNSGQSFIGFDNTLLIINKDMSYSQMEVPYNILGLYCDKDNGLWVGMSKGGVYYFPDMSSMDYKILNLPEFSVTGICEDNEKGIWCSTIEKGIFYCRNKFVINYNNVKGLDKKAEMLRSFDNRIFISSEPCKIVEINNRNLQNHFLNLKDNYLVSDLLPTNEGWVISGKRFIATSNDEFKKNKLLRLKGTSYYTGASQLTFGPDNEVFGIQYGDLIKVNKNFLTSERDPLESPGRCILYTKEQGMLVGCKDGLYKVDLSSFTFNKIPEITGSITKIIESSDHTIWIASKETGVFFLKGNKIFNLNDLVKMPTNRIFDIAEDRYKNIWIGSNIGLLKVKFQNGKAKLFTYNTLDGLPSNEIFNLALNNNSIYLSTNEGICSFALSTQMNNSSHPNIFLNFMQVNGKNYRNNEQSILFPYDENSFKLNFDILTFKENELPSFAYYINGKDIQFNSGNELVLNNLLPGKYELGVYGVNNDKLLSNYPFELNFEIKKPFWKTIVFILCSILFIGAIIYLFIKKIISKIQKREAEKTRINQIMAEHQLSALRAQMNPHFIFNCINSIQRYILTNKSEEAYDYLSKFSKLIRLVLNYSDKNMITLEQEIEIVELYIGLEQMRFDNKFTYRMNCSENIDREETKIPTMIMQPYIENAIWHGLMNLKQDKPGNINIIITCENDLLKIVIEDNGIGREQAQLISKKGHKSKGTDLNKKRTEILNIIGNAQAGGNVIIEDITGNDHLIEGTRVIINIPQNNDDE